MVLGDLDNLLPPILEGHDAVSMFEDSVSGPLMLFCNTTRVNSLYSRGNWKKVLAEPTYCNFEEVQREEGGLTKILQESGMAVHWDNRYSRWEGFPAGVTPYGCRWDGNRLLETPTGRELLLYHFNHTKRWSL